MWELMVLAGDLHTYKGHPLDWYSRVLEGKLSIEFRYGPMVFCIAEIWHFILTFNLMSPVWSIGPQPITFMVTPFLSLKFFRFWDWVEVCEGVCEGFCEGVCEGVCDCDVDWEHVDWLGVLEFCDEVCDRGTGGFLLAKSLSLSESELKLRNRAVNHLSVSVNYFLLHLAGKERNEVKQFHFVLMSIIWS